MAKKYFYMEMMNILKDMVWTLFCILFEKNLLYCKVGNENSKKLLIPLR